MARQPAFVPIPEVNEASDSITVGELGLPVGFDTERLEINVPRVERITRYGDMGHVTISGFRGDTTEQGYSIGGVSDQGVGVAVRTRILSRAKLHSVDIEDEGGFPEAYRWKQGRMACLMLVVVPSI